MTAPVGKLLLLGIKVPIPNGQMLGTRWLETSGDSRELTAFMFPTEWSARCDGGRRADGPSTMVLVLVVWVCFQKTGSGFLVQVELEGQLGAACPVNKHGRLPCLALAFHRTAVTVAAHILFVFGQTQVQHQWSSAKL